MLHAGQAQGSQGSAQRKSHREPSTAPVQGKAILPPQHWVHITLGRFLWLYDFYDIF